MNTLRCAKHANALKVLGQKPQRDRDTAQTAEIISTHLYTWRLQTPNTVHIGRGCGWTEPTFSKCWRSRSTWTDSLRPWSHLTSFPSGLRDRLHSWSKKKKEKVSFQSTLRHCQRSRGGSSVVAHTLSWLRRYSAEEGCGILDHATTGFYCK